MENVPSTLCITAAQCNMIPCFSMCVQQTQFPSAISELLKGFLSRIRFLCYTVRLCHSVSVTKTLRQAVKHAFDMIPRHASHSEGHIHLSTGLTDSSKGRQADTEKGTVNTPQPSQLAARPLIHSRHTEIPEIGLIMLNACQSHTPPGRDSGGGGGE